MQKKKERVVHQSVVVPPDGNYFCTTSKSPVVHVGKFSEGELDQAIARIVDVDYAKYLIEVLRADLAQRQDLLSKVGSTIGEFLGFDIITNALFFHSTYDEKIKVIKEDSEYWKMLMSTLGAIMVIKVFYSVMFMVRPNDLLARLLSKLQYVLPTAIINKLHGFFSPQKSVNNDLKELHSQIKKLVITNSRFGYWLQNIPFGMGGIGLTSAAFAIANQLNKPKDMMSYEGVCGFCNFFGKVLISFGMPIASAHVARNNYNYCNMLNKSQAGSLVSLEKIFAFLPDINVCSFKLPEIFGVRNFLGFEYRADKRFEKSNMTKVVFNDMQFQLDKTMMLELLFWEIRKQIPGCKIFSHGNIGHGVILLRGIFDAILANDIVDSCIGKIKIMIKQEEMARQVELQFSHVCGDFCAVKKKVDFCQGEIQVFFELEIRGVVDEYIKRFLNVLWREFSAVLGNALVSLNDQSLVLKGVQDIADKCTNAVFGNIKKKLEELQAQIALEKKLLASSSSSSSSSSSAPLPVLEPIEKQKPQLRSQGNVIVRTFRWVKHTIWGETAAKKVVATQAKVAPGFTWGNGYLKEKDVLRIEGNNEENAYFYRSNQLSKAESSNASRIKFCGDAGQQGLKKLTNPPEVTVMFNGNKYEHCKVMYERKTFSTGSSESRELCVVVPSDNKDAVLIVAFKQVANKTLLNKELNNLRGGAITIDAPVCSCSSSSSNSL
jgi:hypothetical protein